MLKHLCLALLFCLVFFILISPLHSQDASGIYNKAYSLPDKLFGAINKKSQHLQEKLDRSTQKYLRLLEKRERKLQKRLARKDSAAANEIFGNTTAIYRDLQQRMTDSGQQSTLQNLYSSRLDSMKSVFGFLQANRLLTQSPDMQKKLNSSLNNYHDLQLKLNYTEDIRKKIIERQNYLAQRLQAFSLGRPLRKYQEQVYYYREQLDEYKRTLENPQKLEAKLLRAVSQMPAFRKFFLKNSQLGNLFRLPGAEDVTSVNLQGMQTRDVLMRELQQRLGAGIGMQQAMSQSMTDARSEMDKIKNRISRFGSNAQELDMPGFKPNDLKSRSFLKRLELGTTVQSKKKDYFFPTSTDIALTVGYKLNPKSIAGVGVSYKVGWGEDFRHISISHQGMGLRSFVDVKLKGNFWFTGGGELNYRSGFSDIDILKDFNPWQKCVLIGASKKYELKKMKGNVQVLYDFLHNQHTPVTQPLIFRFGYVL